ncbi:SRPBCC family protein [Microbulbifer variabilis]|uniref:SRPBCC family protein n=1 Tax=Microbulbifer variabilis TaxID=266805 RepID=UPI001CFDD4DD|nr:SRPBCC family protein [Microbulbifer variabilis]
MEISIETTVNAPMENVWSSWTTPEDIQKWNFASDDWCCPDAIADLKINGNFVYRMESKDGTIGFNFEGKFTNIEKFKRIEFVMPDKRKVRIDFCEIDQGVRVIELFDAEDSHSVEMQRQGWQNILNNFKKHVESKVR